MKITEIFKPTKVSVFEPTCHLRFTLSEETGLKVLQQAWLDQSTGEIEWRLVPFVN